MSSAARIALAIILLLGAATPALPQDVAVESRPHALVQTPRRFDLLALSAGLSVENVPLTRALNELRRTSGVSLAFSPSVLGKDYRVTCACGSVTLRTALDQLLDGTDLTYVEQGGILLIEPKRTLGAASSANAPAMVGRVTGLVIDGRSLRPLPGVQVYLPGGRIGGLTNGAGRYMLTNVPAGEVVVHAQIIGFSTVQKRVVVRDDQTATVNFELVEEALALDEIVVTGTPGRVQRRAVGNVVERIVAANILEKSPAKDVQQLIGQRNPGVTVMPSSGQVGGVGGVIRVRGVSSVSQSNDPLVYVDGVRVNSGFSGPATREGSNISRLNDINPEDIESIEVIKGPAAATLYGTEASGGVIQIITKRGADGAPSYEFSMRQGATWLQDPAGRLGLFYDINPVTKVERSFNLYEEEERNGLGPVFQNGHLQSYQASIRGGTPTSRYFVSGDWEDNVGIVDYNWEKRFSSRVNLSLLPRENTTIDLNMAYIQGTTSLAQQSSGWDIWSNLLWGSPRQLDDPKLRGFLRATPEAIAEIEAIAKISRFIGGLTLNYRPMTWLAQRMLVGLDVGDETNWTYFPRHPDGASHFFGASSLGEREVNRPKRTFYTVDYSGTATLRLTPALASATSYGLQMYRNKTETFTSQGREFPAPGLSTVGATAVRTSNEGYTENTTVGVFVQEQLDWRNRWFLTGAVRLDDNSAFGADFDIAVYPKVSGAWVVHEEPFWNVPGVSSLRLRAAFGTAGRQPAAFDASRLYSATTGPNDGPVLTPQSFGNPTLKPERGEEIEAGFDAGLLGDRVNLVFTFYNRTTKDAIVNQDLPPSMGFPGSQVVNVGKTKNWGTETTLEARVLEGSNLSWDAGFTLATYDNKIVTLGPQPGDDREGFPIGSTFFWKILSAEFDRNGLAVNEMCDGGTGMAGAEMGGAPVPCAQAPRVYWGRPDPTWEVGFNSTVNVFRNIRLYGRVEARGGNMGSNNDITSSHTSYQNTLFSNKQDNAIFQAYRKIGRDPLRYYSGRFLKLREISATYTLPTSWAQKVRASRGSLSVSGRNLWTALAQKTVTVPGIGEIPDPQIWDTEMRGLGNQGGQFQSRIPPLAQVLTTVRFTF